MINDIKVLVARRAYEFGPDDIRLTLLSVPFVQEQIRQAFTFQVGALATPMHTFGPVPQTMPPGIVFNAGGWVSPDRQLIPIRFLHFEPQRIVIDIAGESAYIDRIYERLLEVLGGIEAIGRTQVVGGPVRVRDYTEITARLSFSPNAIFKDSLRAVFERMQARREDVRSFIMLPTLFNQMVSPDEPYEGLTVPDPDVFQFALRAGTRIEDRVYLSTAPLDSEAHINYLARVDDAVGAD